MFYQIILVAFLASLCTGLSLRSEEKIDPVDLNHHCIKTVTNKESADLSPILLLHGGGSNLKNWEGVNQVLALSTKRRVCAVDLRNHGDSPWNNRTDIASLAADIGHFLDTQGIKKVNFIGHSVGGITAIRYTLNNPDRVDSIVVEDMRPNGLSQDVFKITMILNKLLELAINSIPEGSTEEEAKESIANLIKRKLVEMGSSVINNEMNYDLRLVDGKWQYNYNFKVLHEAWKDPEYFTNNTGLYEGPALFIYGSKSPFKVNEAKDDILKLFPSAKLVPVEGASHKIHKMFRKFDDVVIKFLNEVK